MSPRGTTAACLDAQRTARFEVDATARKAAA